jgi:hypothetical protein
MEHNSAISCSPGQLMPCLRPPIPEVFAAAKYLDAAVSAHMIGDSELADHLIRAANMDEVRAWTESLWGKASPYVQPRALPNSPPVLSRSERVVERMPTGAVLAELHRRDGFHCRFCGVPVIRKVVRVFLGKLYPAALRWERTNLSQHAAFQAMWAQYDYVLAHARGGDNSIENTIVTCAPCNFAKMNYTLEELGLSDPRTRHPLKSDWDGLERVLKSSTSHLTVEQKLAVETNLQ